MQRYLAGAGFQAAVLGLQQGIFTIWRSYLFKICIVLDGIGAVAGESGASLFGIVFEENWQVGGVGAVVSAVFCRLSAYHTSAPPQLFTDEIKK